MPHRTSVFAAGLRIDHPIIQAPMAGGATTPELVAAVSNAGALGSFGAAMLAPSGIAAQLVKVLAEELHSILLSLS